MGKKELPFSEGFFSERKEYIEDNDGNNGNKEEWSVMILPYYQEIINGVPADNTPPDLEEIKLNIANEHTTKPEQRRCKKILDIYQEKVTEILGYEVKNIYDFLNPNVVEYVIPAFLGLAIAGHRKKAALRKLYKAIFTNAGLSPAFDPIAARIAVHLENKSKQLNNKLPKWMSTGNSEIDLFLEHKKINSKSDEIKICKGWSYDLQLFFKFLAELKTDSRDNFVNISCRDIKQDDIDKFKEHLLEKYAIGEYCSGTIDSKWRRLKRFITFAKGRNWTFVSATGNIIKPASKRPGILSDTEIKDLLEKFCMHECNTMRDFTIFILTLDTGARINEILKLKAENIHKVNSRHAITLCSKGSERTVLLSGPASLTLTNYLNSIGPIETRKKIFTDFYGKDATYAALYNKFKKMLGNDKGKGAWHRLRHTLITNAMQAGANPFDVQRKAGHTDIRYTTGYTHLTKDFLFREAEKFPQIK